MIAIIEQKTSEWLDIDYYGLDNWSINDGGGEEVHKIVAMAKNKEEAEAVVERFRKDQPEDKIERHGDGGPVYSSLTIRYYSIPVIGLCIEKPS